MKLLALGFSIILFAINTKAQEVRLDWVKAYGSSSWDEAESVKSDSVGNIYVTGRFHSSFDSDPGPNVKILTSNGLYDGFVQKFDKFGNLLWARTFGGISQDRAEDLAIDEQGNVYLTGSFENSVNFNPQGTAQLVNAIGSTDIFILKLDKNGDFLWVKTMGGLSSERGNSIILDMEGNPVVTGYFKDTTDLDPGPSLVNFQSQGDTDYFVLKLDKKGDFVWAKAMGGTGTDFGESISSDLNGNICVIGRYINTVDFDPSSTNNTLSSKGGWDIFIQKFDANGNLVWVKSVGGTSQDIGESITIDLSGNILVTGNFRGTADFDPSGNSNNITSKGLQDIFILKLNAAGDFIWAKALEGQRYNSGYCIRTDSQENVYTSGTFTDSIDMDPGVPTYYLNSININSAYIHVMNKDGEFQWVTSTRGIGITSIFVDDLFNILATGSYRGTADFDPGQDEVNITSHGFSDIFIEKFIPKYTEINEIHHVEEDALISPNPTNGLVNIDFSSIEETTIRVVNIKGELVYIREDVISDQHQFELDSPPGLYIVEITIQGKCQRYKLVKK